MTSTATRGGDTDGENLPGFDGCDVLCDKVFANGLIFRKLEKMLSYSDLKVCRLVCRRFNWTILNETDFCTRTIFVLKAETCRVKVLENIGFKLKQVEIHPFYKIVLFGARKYATTDKSNLTKDDVEHVYEKLKEVESIRLKGVFMTDEENQESMPSVQRVIEGATNLKKIALRRFDFRSVAAFDMSWVNLVDFEIDLPDYTCENWVIDAVITLGQLKRLTINDGKTRHYYDSDMDESQDIITFLGLATRNHATLEYLNLCEPLLWKAPFISTTPVLTKTVFPKLCELHMKVHESDACAQEVASFLKTHLKQLHALNVRILGKFPESLLDLIQENATQLKKLSIEAKTFGKSMEGKLAFLANCNNLKEFKLQFIAANSYERHGDSLAAVFSYIPTSVRKLSLLGLPNSGSDTLSISKIQMLSKLSSLKLVRCLDAVTNETLQAIFMNMTSLRKLEITDARNCTDEGFTGTSDDGTTKENTVSISNLKILTSLVLRDCGITDRTVKEEIRFIDLLKLDISANRGITPACIKIAFDNNPALEILRTYYFLGFRGLTHIRTLKESYPRFKKHQITREMVIDYNDSDSEGWDGSNCSSGSLDLNIDFMKSFFTMYNNYEDHEDEDDYNLWMFE